MKLGTFDDAELASIAALFDLVGMDGLVHASSAAQVSRKVGYPLLRTRTALTSLYRQGLTIQQVWPNRPLYHRLSERGKRVARVAQAAGVLPTDLATTGRRPRIPPL